MPMVRSPRDPPDSMASMSFSSASPGEMFSMAAASLATFARPSALDRFMSATISRSTAWIASWVPKPTFLTAWTARFDASALTPWAFARAVIDMLILSVWAACSAAPMVHSFAQSSAFLIESASRLPAAEPLTILTVSPSMPADAPRAAFPAACSMLDKPVLMLLIDAFALLTSTSTTSSSLLLSAMVSRRLLSFQQIPLLRDDQHCAELIRANLDLMGALKLGVDI